MNQKLKVLIGTPSYDGKIDVHYIDSLLKTLEQSDRENVEIYPLFICYDSLIQRARNDLFATAYNSKVDMLVFIDSDIGWEPKDFFKLIKNDKDLIGGSYRKKTDNQELYVIKALDNNDPSLKLDIDENGIMEVAGLGCGFMKISRNALINIWNVSKPYNSDKGNNRMAFEVVCEDNDLISEDIYFCKKWRNLGNKVYLDTSITCVHSGTKTFTGNFRNWIETFKNQASQNNNQSTVNSFDKFTEPTQNIDDDFKVL